MGFATCHPERPGPRSAPLLPASPARGSRYPPPVSTQSGMAFPCLSHINRTDVLVLLDAAQAVPEPPCSQGCSNEENDDRLLSDRGAGTGALGRPVLWRLTTDHGSPFTLEIGESTPPHRGAILMERQLLPLARVDLPIPAVDNRLLEELTQPRLPAPRGPPPPPLRRRHLLRWFLRPPPGPSVELRPRSHPAPHPSLARLHLLPARPAHRDGRARLRSALRPRPPGHLLRREHPPARYRPPPRAHPHPPPP